MADDLHRPIARALSPSVTGVLARTLGEPIDAVRSGVRGALTAVFRAANAKAGTEAGAGEILSVVRDQHGANAGLLRDVEARLRRPDASGLLAERSAAVDRLFSGRATGVAAHLASFAKIKPGSAGALLTFATEMMLAAMQEAGVVSQGPTGLRRLLRSEEAEARRVAPPGFDPDVGPPAGASGSTGGGARWLPWLLAGLSLLALLFLLLRRGEPSEPDPHARAAAAASVAESVAPPPQPAAPAAAPGTTERVTLPNGRTLDLVAGTLAYELAQYLGSDAAPGRTFTFEALEFRPGSSRLQPQAESTLESLALILEAYPNARVRLEGHTDEVGDSQGNQRLSEARAFEAAEALLAYGVTPERVTAAGFGETRPLIPGAAGRAGAANRRTDLAVIRK